LEEAPIQGSLTTYIEVFFLDIGNDIGYYIEATNSYTYIEVQNIDINHYIEYNIFIYVYIYQVFSTGQTTCPISDALCSIPAGMQFK
jgi:hypothetical protein